MPRFDPPAPSVSASLLFLLAAIPLAGCAHNVAPPPLEPVALASAPAQIPVPAPEPEPSGRELIDEALTRSDQAFFAALEAYRDGDHAAARQQFEESLRILADVDPEFLDEPRLGDAYRDRFEDIQELEFRRAEIEAQRQEDTPADRLAAVSDDVTPDDEAAQRKTAESARQEVTYDIPVVLNDRVLRFVELYQGEWRKQFAAGFVRSGGHLEMIHRIFDEEGVPRDLAYMAHVESSFKPRALSRVGAYGMWQFMSATGRQYGLRRTYWMDERADPEKAARAAARYLKFLHGMFDDWHLAMAAYNAGENKVARAIRYTGKHDFWAIADTRYLRRETRNFVPAILAAAIIYRSPEKYGFDPSSKESPVPYETLRVDSQTDLTVLAECAGTDVDTLRSLNTELRRNTTPPELTEYLLRVPVGTGTRARVQLAAIPKSQRVRQVIHVVRRGDTLSGLAARYGTSVSAIQTTNGIRNPRRLQLGAQLSIPLTQGAYAPMAARAEVDPDSGLPMHTVRRGENPYVIARAHGIPLSSLLGWNGLRKGTIIYPGMKLVLAPGATASPALQRVELAQSTSSAEHVVRRGDNPDSIAKRYGVSLDDLLRWNSLGRRSIIYPGQRLRLVARDGDAVADAGTGGDRTLVYVVKRGDTLYDIGRAYTVTVADLCRWNRISSRSLLHAGDRLTIHRP